MSSSNINCHCYPPQTVEGVGDGVFIVMFLLIISNIMLTCVIGFVVYSWMWIDEDMYVEDIITIEKTVHNEKSGGLNGGKRPSETSGKPKPSKRKKSTCNEERKLTTSNQAQQEMGIHNENSAIGISASHVQNEVEVGIASMITIPKDGHDTGERNKKTEVIDESSDGVSRPINSTEEGTIFKEPIEPQEQKLPNNDNSALHCKAPKKKGGKSRLRADAPEFIPVL